MVRKKKRIRKPSIRANFYSIEKIVYKKRRFQYVTNPKGYLYSGATIQVKVKKEDLPSYFVPGRFKKCYGFIRTNKVKDLVYLSRTEDNHFMKDDILLISYDTPIVKDNSCGDLFNYRGYDEYIFGLDILTFIKGVLIYSPDVDVSYIIQAIRDKKDALMVNDREAYIKEADNVDLEDFFINKEVNT